MSELEIRLESQEQYFRRTSLEIVSPIFSDSTGIILLRTSGLVRASRTLSVMFFLDTGVFFEKIGETISTLIESEIQACVETHINPLKEIVHKQEKTIENHEQKMPRSLRSPTEFRRRICRKVCF
jgi:hypothetical protein